MSDRIFILGAGRAGRGLARALRSSGAEVVGLHGTRASGGEEAVTSGNVPATIGASTIVLVTVRDGQLGGALQQVADASLAPGTVVLHASGSTDPPALVRIRARGYPAGTFHPLVPIVDPARAPALLRGAWIGVDGDPEAVAAARRLAVRIDASVLDIPPGQKGRYHAAAVFAANFPTVLASIASRLLHGAGVDAADGWQALLVLMGAAVRNMRERQPSDALTGPVVRGDVDTVAAHSAALADDAAALTAYRVLSRAAVDLAESAGTDPALLRRIREVLD